ncbi:MAG: indolepyruvate ferredoxin oxidoreductase subunit alpha [Alphaproteobacteria bacterium]|nr:indolepyruvate ferredoxin oxidoreductase subunit alpha [Alphaproteobacteria bacterium]
MQLQAGISQIKELRSGERSFAKEIVKLKLGDGEVFHGEAILAITKALLQAGVAYVGGYPGAPMSHLIDVLAEAKHDILDPLGIQFEQSASEAGAAALLSASIHYPLRGAVTWKSVVGTNVASDAISNLASTGVTGGAVMIIGEDYGEGSSIMQERTHAFAMKSSLPLIDPRHDMEKIVDLTEQAFELSEAANSPVFMSFRIRACHMTGSFIAKDNKEPQFNTRNPVPESRADVTKIVLPPASFAQEQEKFDRRIPAAQKFIQDHKMNEFFPGAGGRFGIITQGGIYSMLARALAVLGAADAFGNTDIPLYVLNVVHPLVPEEILDFIKDKDHVLVVEEAHPNFIESQIAELAHKHEIACRIHGKDYLPMAGEYTTDAVRDGVAKYLSNAAQPDLQNRVRIKIEELDTVVAAGRKSLQNHMPDKLPPRPPSFCTGCPERPIFAALKLIMRERGPFHISMDIGCNLFGALPPFNVGSTVLGYGLSLASAGAVGPALGQSTVAVMGDGGYWHNGMATGAINAQWNNYDSVLIILDNGFAAGTGQQKTPSTGVTPTGIISEITIEQSLRGLGINWIRQVDSYDLPGTLSALRDALDARSQGLRVILSNNECMLSVQRRKRPEKSRELARGHPVTGEMFGVDAEVCTGDHSCMRLNGCPSLTLKPSTDPLKETPVAHVEQSCVACGHCGEVAHAAQLCPSFYRSEGLHNAGPLRRFGTRINSELLSLLGANAA